MLEYQAHHSFKGILWCLFTALFCIWNLGSIKEKKMHHWANFLDFKMMDDKEVTSHIQAFHMLINDLKNENINLP